MKNVCVIVINSAKTRVWALDCDLERERERERQTDRQTDRGLKNVCVIVLDFNSAGQGFGRCIVSPITKKDPRVGNLVAKIA